VVGVRGLFAVCYALLAFLWPEHVLRVLILLFGCYALVDGLFALWAGMGATANKEFMRASLLEGIIGVAVGSATLLVPSITELTLVYLVAVWAILTGLFEIFAVDKKDRVTLNEWPLAVFGAISICAGMLLFVYPHQGMLVLAWLIGGYTLYFGVTLLHLAWKLYRHELHKSRLHPLMP